MLENQSQLKNIFNEIVIYICIYILSNHKNADMIIINAD